MPDSAETIVDAERGGITKTLSADDYFVERAYDEKLRLDKS